jgi:hypothetical protein
MVCLDFKAGGNVGKMPKSMSIHFRGKREDWISKSVAMIENCSS